MDNIIIIGSGPAGISSALYTLRAGIKTTIISTGKSALDTAKEVENYYGFTNPITGPTLLADGIAQAKRLGAEIITDATTGEIVAIEEDDKGEGFIVKTLKTSYNARVAILATGSSRTKPKWEGIDTYDGMGVSYCAVCDGFFFRGKDVAVAGNGAYALHEAQALLPIVGSVTLCTDGLPLTAEFPKEIKIVDTSVASLGGDGAISSIKFKDGTSLDISALFVAMGTAGSSELAKAVGADVKNNDIVVDSNMCTSIPGLFAAGDCTGGMKQIAKAVYEGAVAGTQAVKIIQKQKI